MAIHAGFKYEKILLDIHKDMCELNLINESDRSYDLIYFRRYAKILEYIENIYVTKNRERKNIKILDIGGLGGYVLIALKSLGFNDLSIADTSFYNNNPYWKNRYDHYGIKTYSCELGSEELSKIVEGNHFDLVTCTETIEHFNFNPIPFVKDLKNIMKVGGGIVVTVPNSVSISHRITTLFGRSPNIKIEDFINFYEKGWNYSLHWCEYAMKDLIKLFEYCGFNVEYKGYWKGDLRRWGDSIKIKKKIKKQLELLLLDIFHFIPKFREKIFLFALNT